ncbi:hypothetical protein DSM112329_01962 [Paraconexibacter sp. AEG42_29]|uniref:DUF559 domain-containing protein n=1 Tax=Paraconexibacter sp. AEG42_29 TaxID=2997339 RepID=A0AAU7AU34_9ACTN
MDHGTTTTNHAHRRGQRTETTGQAFIDGRAVADVCVVRQFPGRRPNTDRDRDASPRLHELEGQRYIRFTHVGDAELAKRLQRICDSVGDRSARSALRERGQNVVHLDLELGSEIVHAAVTAPVQPRRSVRTSEFAVSWRD